MGLGKEAMCVVSEELSRGYIGVGSLGTRSEIAAELILGGGTRRAESNTGCRRSPAARCCPPPCSPSPTPARTLPRCKTRAVRDGDVYRITGQKTWITHPVRADLMTLLARTDPGEPGYQGPVHVPGRKAARHGRQPVPAPRHERRRDRGARLSRHEGIRDFLRRFRGAGRQHCSAATRARASSSSCRPSRPRASRRRRAPSAWRNPPWISPCAMRKERMQFGKPIVNFPRVSDKIAMMAVEIMIARQLTYFAARREGRRPPLRSRSRHGQAARRARRLGSGG